EQISSTPSRDSLRPMAQALSVSIPALALRLEEMGVVEDGTFEAASLLSYEGREVWRRKGGGGQNTHPSPTIAERGTSFSDAVYGAWVAKEISLGEAAHAMGIRPDYVPLIRDKIESRHDRLG